MIETISLLPGVTLRACRDTRFKQGCLSVQFLLPLCRQDAALNALVPSVLLRGSRSLPDLRAVTAALDELYGSSIGIRGWINAMPGAASLVRMVNAGTITPSWFSRW